MSIEAIRQRCEVYRAPTSPTGSVIWVGVYLQDVQTLLAALDAVTGERDELRETLASVKCDEWLESLGRLEAERDAAVRSRDEYIRLWQQVTAGLLDVQAERDAAVRELASAKEAINKSIVEINDLRERLCAYEQPDDDFGPTWEEIATTLRAEVAALKRIDNERAMECMRLRAALEELVDAVRVNGHQSNWVQAKLDKARAALDARGEEA